MKNGSKLVLETMFQMDNFEVRTIALGSTDGLKRGDKVLRTNAPISVPVGEKTLGRIFNVLGQAVDGLGIVDNAKKQAQAEFDKASKQVGSMSVDLSKKIVSKILSEIFTEQDKTAILSKAVEKIEKGGYEKATN